MFVVFSIIPPPPSSTLFPYTTLFRSVEPARLYNVSRVEAFYRHQANEIVLIPVFAGVVDARAAVRHSAEHDRAEWLRPPEAAARFSWPRERRALDDVLSILSSGGAGLLEDVLRVF